MLNAILQLESQGECRESATEAVLMRATSRTGSPIKNKPDDPLGTLTGA